MEENKNYCYVDYEGFIEFGKEFAIEALGKITIEEVYQLLDNQKFMSIGITMAMLATKDKEEYKELDKVYIKLCNFIDLIEDYLKDKAVLTTVYGKN